MDVIELAKQLFGESAAVVQPAVLRWLTPEEVDTLFAGTSDELELLQDERSDQGDT